MRTEATGCSGYMRPTMSDGPSCVSTKRAIWSRGDDARLSPDVIVVQENREQAHIVARCFGFLVGVGPNLTRRTVGAGDETAVERDQLERFDFLRAVLLDDLEVFGLEIFDRIAVLVGDDDVDPDKIDTRPEDRLVGRRRRLRRGRRCLLAGRWWTLRRAGSLGRSGSLRSGCLCRPTAGCRSLCGVRDVARHAAEQGRHQAKDAERRDDRKATRHGFYLRPIAC